MGEGLPPGAPWVEGARPVLSSLGGGGRPGPALAGGGRGGETLPPVGLEELDGIVKLTEKD